MSDERYTLPYGSTVVAHVFYSQAESHGPLALAVTAGVSLCAVTAMLIAIIATGFKTQHRFARSQVGGYFLSLVLSDLIQAAGSIMNARWVVIQGVRMGPFCTTQAALKQTGNVGTALWSLVIATHTFCLLFLRMRVRDTIFYCTLVGVWVLIGFVVMMGPVILQDPSRGPFWGVSGYWCWITDAYHTEQFTDEYLFMFLTSVTSLVLYSLIFFRLRGNLQGYSWNLRFRRAKTPWAENNEDEPEISAVGRQMLWYPLAYTVIIVPIAVCRWSDIFGHKVPYGATITADAIFMLSGLVNAILYSTTRKIVFIPSLLPFSRLVHIGSRRLHRPHITPSKASLDDMQFAIPTSVNIKVALDSNKPTAPPPASQVGLWQHRLATDFPDYVRDDLGRDKGISPSRQYKLKDSNVPPSAEYSLDKHTMPPSVPRQGVTLTLRQHPHSSAPVLSSPIASNISPHPSQESPLTTDGAPSLHRKRFSGWSFPSMENVTPREDDSVHTELDSIRFSSPSPERILKESPSRSGSTGDLASPRWPPKVDSFG